MNTPYQYNDSPGILERLRCGFKRFGVRVIVHTASLLASIALATVGEPAAAAASGTLLAVFSGYLGLICLFSSGLSRGLNGLLPFGLGLLQTGITAALGAPLHGALLSGGIQTFLQRALLTKGRMGLEWVSLPLVFISGLALLNSYGLSFEAMPGPLLAGAASFAVVGFTGWIMRVVLCRSMLRPVFRQKLSASISRLESGLASKQLPAPMQQQVRIMLGELRQYSQALPPLDAQVEESIFSLERTSQQVLALAARREPRLWDKEAGAAHTAVLRASNMMRPWLTDQAAEELASSTPAELPETAQAQQENADRLLAKKNLLPPELQSYVETIYRSTQNILDVLRDRPQMEHAAVQFLNRYLGATHRVADEIAKLGKSGNGSEVMPKQIARSKDLLARLETAFTSEHAHLLQADVINLKAELGVLDSLLKMDGY